MAYDLNVVNLHAGFKLDTACFMNIARGALRMIGARPAGLSIAFVDKALIRKLNKKFKSEDSATDVLSFALKVPGAGPACPYCDIAISIDAAVSNARKYSTTASEELALYVIHGILHQFGYDDLTDSGSRVMALKQNDILRRLCRSRLLSKALTPR